MSVRPAAALEAELSVPVVVIGAGACGMVAALAAREAGAEVLVVERDAVPAGSTAMSSGMIAACGTRLQRAHGIADSVELMAADVQRKAGGEADRDVVDAVCRTTGPTVDWLVERHGVELTLVEGFLYPGHSRLRMHAPPSRSGADLIGGLTRAVEAAGVDLVSGAQATDLYADADGRVHGLGLRRADGSAEAVRCGALVLACCGFGGNPEMVRRYIPEISAGAYFGHAGNQGDAVLWGEALGAAVRHMGAYQGHGALAHPQRIMITWALMMEGGIQVNLRGERFANEHQGYSEHAVAVLSQPSAVAWTLYDARLHGLGQGFEDYRQAEAAGAIKSAQEVAALARVTGLPAAPLAATIAATEAYAAGERPDPLGRDFAAKPALAPPYYAVKVTGALFHTQGGLVVDRHARVRRPDGGTLANLFAGGGAACGVSGPEVSGYLSGNGLLTAVGLGRLAGAAAARQVLGG
ncbi:MAG: FAD-dependent oxidoreductase [Alphaproteobacteria bacterium]